MYDWGTIEFSEIADLANAGEHWYRIAATRDGLLTIESLFAHAAGNVDLELYDASMQLIGSSNGSRKPTPTRTANECVRLLRFMSFSITLPDPRLCRHPVDRRQRCFSYCTVRRPPAAHARPTHAAPATVNQTTTMAPTGLSRI